MPELRGRTHFMSLVSSRLPVTVFAVLTPLLASVVSADTAPRQDKILIMGTPSGSQTVTQTSDSTQAEYSFNDRGRGNHITASWKLDAAGVPTEYSGSGNDYMKARVTETFRVSNGK